MVTSSGLVYLAKKSFKRKRRRGFLKIRSGIATLSFSVHLSQHRAATILGFGQKLKLQMVVAFRGRTLWEFFIFFFSLIISLKVLKVILITRKSIL